MTESEIKSLRRGMARKMTAKIISNWERAGVDFSFSEKKRQLRKAFKLTGYKA